MGTSVEDSSLDILKSQNLCSRRPPQPTILKTYNSQNLQCNTNVEILIEKEPLTACEEAIYSCCSSPKSTFLQSARCFELNSCPGINFIENPCLFLSSVLSRI